MKEFLFAILAFHPQREQFHASLCLSLLSHHFYFLDSSASSDLDAAHLFFNFFDVKESGLSLSSIPRLNSFLQVTLIWRI
jgi:hypothetical protein